MRFSLFFIALVSTSVFAKPPQRNFQFGEKCIGSAWMCCKSNCVIQPGLNRKVDACVHIQTNSNNCGSCGVICNPACGGCIDGVCCVEEPTSTSTFVEEPTSTSTFVEEPTTTTSVVEEPTSSFVEEPTSTTSVVEEPTL